MSQAHVDPAELRRFAQDLHRFNHELHSLMTGLNGRLHGLEASWRDQEHRQFVESFQQTAKALTAFLDDSQAHVQFLNKKASLIEEYLRRR
jgi:uncharacterized protein YukE